VSPESLQDELLGWGLPRLRDLPWRRTRDPWAVLVSEFMLQQTQVARVLPKYLAFLQDYPTPAACADAAAGDIVRAWAGLGYNRRALNLHRSAAVVTGMGGFPQTLAGLMALPGVGAYTARAILAFAFEADVAVVDTNIARVLARLHGRSLAAAEVQAAADRLVPTGEGWAWNQVLMELGATTCTARVWVCEGCPLRPGCGWTGDGPDPAIGSAGVSGGQSRFAGSDRQGRGRLVDALRQGAVSAAVISRVMGWPGDIERSERVAATLVRDGLAVIDGDRYRLP
jgi:A/G-specific adenine glycosylase